MLLRPPVPAALQLYHHCPASLKMGGGTDGNREEELEEEVGGEMVFLKTTICIRKRKLPSSSTGFTTCSTMVSEFLTRDERSTASRVGNTVKWRR